MGVQHLWKLQRDKWGTTLKELLYMGNIYSKHHLPTTEKPSHRIAFRRPVAKRPMKNAEGTLSLPLAVWPVMGKR